ncbi:MAG: enoyl-CoA hydratase/isomerase family protein [Myxococcales bacterium]|nr:enoyl-CoA hydratase/isomerase family protein [Myxococcales bacterium]MCB9542579.1 enoyl-CoA hydratase/isomerase family protein [Myxococcales bacterium]
MSLGAKETIRADLFGDPEHERVRYDRRGPVALLTLTDEGLNGYTYRMFRQLDEYILHARFDPEVQAIVITGDGEHFCAGANIKMLEAADATSKYYFCLHANETLSRLEQTPKLVIAAINGHCVGGGFEIALACDLRIARRAGGRIGLPEVNLGVLPGTGGTQRLTRLLGPAKAMALMLSGETLESDAALAAGLVTGVIGETRTEEVRGKAREVPAMGRDAFVEAVISVAQRYCAPERAALAVGHIKRAVQSGGELPLEYGLALERELQAKLFASDDAREGLAAFVEKRAAKFEGR